MLIYKNIFSFVFYVLILSIIYFSWFKTRKQKKNAVLEGSWNGFMSFQLLLKGKKTLGMWLI